MRGARERHRRRAASSWVRTPCGSVGGPKRKGGGRHEQAQPHPRDVRLRSHARAQDRRRHAAGRRAQRAHADARGNLLPDGTLPGVRRLRAVTLDLHDPSRAGRAAHRDPGLSLPVLPPLGRVRPRRRGHPRAARSPRQAHGRAEVSHDGGEGAAVKEVDVTLPPDVELHHVPGDRTLGEMLAAGDLDAYMGARRPACYGKGVSRLFPDYRRVERAWYERTGIFPIMHTVVLKQELVTEHPWLPRSFYTAFVEAKRQAYERIDFTAALLTSLPWQMAEAEETQALMGDDPFAYGIARNRKNVETLVGYSHRQGLAPRRLAVEEMFVESLLDT